MVQTGGPRCKTGSFDLQNVAISRHQSLMHGLVYCCCPLYVVPIHAKLESVLPAYAGDQLILSGGFRVIGRVSLYRRSAVKSPIVQLMQQNNVNLP
jgi:hypothetical protein